MPLKPASTLRATKPKQHQNADLTPRNYLSREAKCNITRQDIIAARHYAFHT